MFSTVSFICKNRWIKQKFIIVIFALTNLVINSSAQKFTEPLHLKTIQYNLDLKVDFENQKLVADCELTVMNPTSEKCSIIPKLLYRLMKVSAFNQINKN